MNLTDNTLPLVFLIPQQTEDALLAKLESIQTKTETEISITKPLSASLSDRFLFISPNNLRKQLRALEQLIPFLFSTQKKTGTSAPVDVGLLVQLIPDSGAPMVVGRKGDTLRRIREESLVRELTLDECKVTGTELRPMIMRGNSAQIISCVGRISTILSDYVRADKVNSQDFQLIPKREENKDEAAQQQQRIVKQPPIPLRHRSGSPVRKQPEQQQQPIQRKRSRTPPPLSRRSPSKPVISSAASIKDSTPIVNLKFLIPSTLVGSLIGKGGNNLRTIRQITGASLTCDRPTAAEQAVLTDRFVKVSSNSVKSVVKAMEYILVEILKEISGRDSLIVLCVDGGLKSAIDQIKTEIKECEFSLGETVIIGSENERPLKLKGKKDQILLAVEKILYHSTKSL
jgi:KH domain